MPYIRQTSTHHDLTTDQISWTYYSLREMDAAAGSNTLCPASATKIRTRDKNLFPNLTAAKNRLQYDCYTRY